MSALFTTQTFEFLKQLKANNRREWFQENKQDYLNQARDPMLRFIQELQGVFRSLSPRFSVNPKPTGGSMFRIHRDIRFSKDKSPYKTHLAARFPHVDGEKGSAPGFYLSIQVDGGYAAAGLWRPETHALSRVRKAIADHSEEWRRVTQKVEVEGDRLKRPPRGYPADHPLIEDLKLKDYVASHRLTVKQICQPDFLLQYVRLCREMSPLVRFLCRALKLPW